MRTNHQNRMFEMPMNRLVVGDVVYTNQGDYEVMSRRDWYDPRQIELEFSNGLNTPNLRTFVSQYEDGSWPVATVYQRDFMASTVALPQEVRFPSSTQQQVDSARRAASSSRVPTVTMSRNDPPSFIPTINDAATVINRRKEPDISIVHSSARRRDVGATQFTNLDNTSVAGGMNRFLIALFILAIVVFLLFAFYYTPAPAEMFQTP